MDSSPTAAASTPHPHSTQEAPIAMTAPQRFDEAMVTEVARLAHTNGLYLRVDYDPEIELPIYRLVDAETHQETT
jgi:hypothetical protein